MGDLLRIVGALPRHRHAIAESSHQFFRQRHVAHEEDSHTGGTSSFQYPGDLRHNGLRIFDLLQDTDLHVIDDKRKPPWVADFFKAFGDVETMDTLHGRYLQRRGD
jgi:hypothetical protein